MPVRTYTAALRSRAPGARVAFWVSRSTGGVNAAQIQAVPTENTRRRVQLESGWSPSDGAKAEDRKYPRPTTVHPANTSNQAVCRDPTTRLDGETGMAPQRIRRDHRRRSTIKAAPRSTNDSGMSDTSGGMKRRRQGTNYRTAVTDPPCVWGWSGGDDAVARVSHRRRERG